MWKIKSLAYYQILGGIFGIGLTAYLFLTSNSYHVILILILILFLAIYSYSIFCGIMLLKKRMLGFKHSKINQLLQLIHFSILGYAFQYIAGLHISISIDLADLLNLKINLGTSTWEFAFNKNSETSIISVNLLAIFLIIFIDKQMNEHEILEITNQISSFEEA